MPTLCALCENVVIVLKSGRFVAAAPVNFKFKRINDGISHTVTSHQLYSPISCGQNIPSRETRAKSARIWELREPWVVAELEPVVWTLSLFHHDAILWAPRWMDALGFSLQFRVFLSCHLRLAPGHGSSSRAGAGMAPIPPLQRGRKLPLWASKSQVRRIPQQTDMALMAPTISTSSSTQSFDTPLISIAVGHREQTANTNCAKCQQDFSEFC